MSNPFKLTDEQLKELEKKHTQYEVFDFNRDPHGRLVIISGVKEILIAAERMTKENAVAAKATTLSKDIPYPWDELEYDWAAFAENGQLYNFPHKPVHEGYWFSGYLNITPQIPIQGELKHYSQAVADGKIDWRTTLRERPKKEEV